MNNISIQGLTFALVVVVTSVEVDVEYAVVVISVEVEVEYVVVNVVNVVVVLGRRVVRSIVLKKKMNFTRMIFEVDIR
jgi:hypothetical protein